MKKLFDTQAKKNNLYTLIDWQDVFQRKIHNTAATRGQTIQQSGNKATNTNAENRNK